MSNRRTRFAVLLLAFLVTPALGTAQTSCPPLDTAAAWARVNRGWANEAGLRWSNDSLRRVLLDLRERDQAARVEFAARATDTLYIRTLMARDSALSAQMTVILDRFGLPTRAMVGAKGSDAALLIVQHSASLQARVFQLARAAQPGQISAERLAMLEDRVLVQQGKPQRYGTQFSLAPDGRFAFAPTSDTTSLDALRIAAGMPPLAQYVCLLEENGMRVDRSTLPPRFRTSGDPELQMNPAGIVFPARRRP
ncbi:MAG: DUF6624 domain-containing protein [Gemmatimonadota bacterium]